MPPAAVKQRHRLVSFSPEQTNANGRYSYRTETPIDVTECEYNGQQILPLQHIAANGHDRYRTLRHMNFTAGGSDRYRTSQRVDITADGHNRYRTLQHMDITADGRDRYRTLQRMDFTASIWTIAQMDTIPRGTNPKDTIPNELLHNY